MKNTLDESKIDTTPIYTDLCNKPEVYMIYKIKGFSRCEETAIKQSESLEQLLRKYGYEPEYLEHCEE